MNINQTKKKKNYKSKTHKTLSLFIRRVRREKKVRVRGGFASMAFINWNPN
jgi:hypothetical protein